MRIWQLCPKCNGQGKVSKPPYIAGDINEWVGSSISYVCDVCNGVKIIQTPDQYINIKDLVIGEAPRQERESK